MSLSEPYDDRLMADLAAAADGTLPHARQAELEALAEQDAELAAALDEQRRAMTLIRGAAAEVRAPLALRERLEADRARLARPRARRRWFSVATAGALAAAVLLAVVLAGPGGPDAPGGRRVRRAARGRARAGGGGQAAGGRAGRRRVPRVGREVRLEGDRDPHGRGRRPRRDDRLLREGRQDARLHDRRRRRARHARRREDRHRRGHAGQALPHRRRPPGRHLGARRATRACWPARASRTPSSPSSRAGRASARSSSERSASTSTASRPGPSRP